MFVFNYSSSAFSAVTETNFFFISMTRKIETQEATSARIETIMVSEPSPKMEPTVLETFPPKNVAAFLSLKVELLNVQSSKATPDSSSRKSNRT